MSVIRRRQNGKLSFFVVEIRHGEEVVMAGPADSRSEVLKMRGDQIYQQSSPVAAAARRQRSDTVTDS